MNQSEPEQNGQGAGLDRPWEHCGLFGAWGVADAASVIQRGLFALQHRGQEGAGIVVSDGKNVSSVKGPGLLQEVMARPERQHLHGHLGIGHVRYSTTGASRPQNVQPLVVECADGLWAVAHNGNLTNAKALRSAYQNTGAIFQTGTDSEVLVHMLADPMYRLRPRRVERALGDLAGAFAYLLMNPTQVMAARDTFGFRPLSIGRLGSGVVFASETCAIEQVGAEHVRDVLPGELVVVDAGGIRSSTFGEPRSYGLGQCVFELIYFARPDSAVFGENVHEFRVRLGRTLAREAPADADVVIPIPDSGMSAALGFSQQSGLPLDYGYIRNHYVGRTFILPAEKDRAATADLKLSLIAGVVRGRRVVVVDDSIVRGNTARRRVLALKQAGATEVHVRVSCPPIRHPCFFGIDFPSEDELVAARREPADVARLLEADSLAYLSLEGLLATVARPEMYCTGCFAGSYPLDPGTGHHKLALERPGWTDACP